MNNTQIETLIEHLESFINAIVREDHNVESAIDVINMRHTLCEYVIELVKEKK